MKNLIGGTLATLAFVFIVGIGGAYTASNITLAQCLIFEALAFAVGYIGYALMKRKGEK